MISTFLQALSVAVAALPFVVAMGVLVGGFLAVCHAAGRLLVTGSSASFGDRMVVSTPIGMVVLGMVAFALAAVGQLSALSVSVASLVLVVSARRHWRADLDEIRDRIRSFLANPSERCLLGPGLAAAAGFLATCYGLLLIALYPRLDIDETLYHLPFTRALLETGELPFLAHLRYPVFPILQEALWTPLLATLGQSGPSALVAMQTAWVGLLLAFWVGGRLGIGYGALAAGLWLGCPIGWWTGTQAMVDSALALCTATAAFCLDRWEAGRSRRWLVLAGIAAGGGVATKYHGLLLLGLLAVPVVAGWEIRRRAKALVLLVASAVLVALPVYGWITATTGNPVFPFAARTFGASQWSQQSLRTGGPEAVREADLGTVVSVRFVGAIQELDSVPFLIDRLTISGYAQGATPPLSIWMLVLAPFGLLAVWKPPWMRPRIWALIFLLYVLMWFASAPEPRYLYSALPLLIPLYTTGLSVAARALPHRVRSATAGVATTLLVLPGLVYGAEQLDLLGTLPTSGLARENFLREHRPGYIALRDGQAHWADEHAGQDPPKIFTLFGSDLQYFSQVPLHGDWYGPDRYSRFGDFRQSEIVETLRKEGFDYLLEVYRRGTPTVEPFPGLKLLHLDNQSALWEITPSVRQPPAACDARRSTAAP